MFEELGKQDDIGYARYFLGWCYAFGGKFEKAIDNAEKAIKIFEDTRNLGRMALPYLLLGFSYLIQGNWKKAVDALEKCIKIARPLGDIALFSGGLLLSGYGLFMKGKRKEGLLTFMEGFEMIKARQVYLYYSKSFGWLAQVFAKSERMEEAIDTAKNGLEWATKGWKGWEHLSYYALAQAEAQNTSSNPREVDQWMEKGLSLCLERGQMPFLAQGYFEYAKILFGRGDMKKAQEYLEQAGELFAEMKMTWWMKQAQDLG